MQGHDLTSPRREPAPFWRRSKTISQRALSWGKVEGEEGHRVVGPAIALLRPERIDQATEMRSGGKREHALRGRERMREGL